MNKNRPWLTTDMLMKMLCLGLLLSINLQASEHIPDSTADAHWLSAEIILLNRTAASQQHSTYLLRNSQGQQTPLQPSSLSKELAEQYPHLADFTAYSTQLSAQQVKQWIKYPSQVVSGNGEPSHASNASNARLFGQLSSAASTAKVQTGFLLDALYTQGDNDADELTDLGTTITPAGIQFKLWAPTAQQVSVLVFKSTDFTKPASAVLAMQQDSNTGAWQITTEKANTFDYYQYQVTVYHPISQQVETLITTDPYSLSLSTNSTHSQIVDLTDQKTQPHGWAQHQSPPIANPEANILYESHVRDFSANDYSITDSELRGKYKAFSQKHSDGIKHLKALRHAGLNNIHLLPVYDIATVNEDPEQVISLDDPLHKLCAMQNHLSVCSQPELANRLIRSILQSYDVNSTDAQALVSAMRTYDNYNWGYDPFHYTVPEGSYATEPMGFKRIIEFRQMVQSLHQMGFRVIMDVVYNHTYQFGLNEKSVLDKIVPGYYHRLNPNTGEVEQSTCYTCGNTATERVMMEKLMTDSLVTWARDHKIDGFRFDLMGHQPKAAMLRARQAVKAVDPDSYFYGEGWNFGEVANHSQFTQASQLALGGTEIGTFSDRLRDAVRGSGNNTRETQGIGNGLLTKPNELQNSNDDKTEYLLKMDQIRVGLAANLAHFPLDNTTQGKDIPYGNQPTGYALDPADTINYVSKHDNQTLWDNSQYRLPFNTTTAQRVRYHNLSLAYVLFGQGIPFIHMGSELLRSKSFLRDSYDYGDWFNAVDHTGQSNNYHLGLPPADKDADNWPLIRQVLAGHQGQDIPKKADILFARDVFKDMLTIRSSSPLFSLTTADAVITKLSFLNRRQSLDQAGHQQGLIVMHLDDGKGIAVDNTLKGITVLFNSSEQPQWFKHPLAEQYRLHPQQRNGRDEITQTATTSAQGFYVPGLTAAVFVKPQ